MRGASAPYAAGFVFPNLDGYIYQQTFNEGNTACAEEIAGNPL